MTSCKRKLATLWFVWWIALFLIFLLQSIFGNYGQNWDTAWGWFLPAVIPTLSLIVGVLVMDASGQSVQQREVDRFLFRLTFGLSVVYLLTVSSAIFLQPFAELPPLELMQQYNVFLGIFQGLVSAALGAFFVRAEQAGSATPQSG